MSCSGFPKPIRDACGSGSTTSPTTQGRSRRPARSCVVAMISGVSVPGAIGRSTGSTTRRGRSSSSTWAIAETCTGEGRATRDSTGATVSCFSGSRTCARSRATPRSGRTGARPRAPAPGTRARCRLRWRRRRSAGGRSRPSAGGRRSPACPRLGGAPGHHNSHPPESNRRPTDYECPDEGETNRHRPEQPKRDGGSESGR